MDDKKVQQTKHVDEEQMRTGYRVKYQKAGVVSGE